MDITKFFDTYFIENQIFMLKFNELLKIKLYKFISLKAGFEYSFIPVELEYTNSENVKINEKTNLGGLGVQTGLSFNF